MALNIARRAAVVWFRLLIMICRCRSIKCACEHSERNFFPSARVMHFPTVSKQTTFQTIGRHHRKRILTDREARALNQHQQYARHEEHGSESQVIVVHTKQRQNVDYCTYNERGFDIMAIKGQSVKAMSELYMEGQGKRTCRTRDQRSGEQVKRGRTRRASKRDTKLANSQRNQYLQRTNAEELRKPNQNQWRQYPIPNTAQEGPLE